MYQHLALRIPHLKRDLAFIRVAVKPGCGFAQGLVERLVKFGVLVASQRHAHDALQQPRVLGQLCVIYLGYLVVAVMQVEGAENHQAGEHQADDQGQGAASDRHHRRSSTR